MLTFDGPLLHDRWRLGPKYGHGGQGQTFLARDEKPPGERVVVVKVLRLGEAGWKKLDLFEREARVLRSLSHPGIPRVLDQFEGEPGTFHLVMEKAPGASLRAIATRVRFSEQELREILARALEILVYLHERQPPVIHRDVKPANLLRAADGTISLVDFGGVREALRSEGGTTVVGTFGYMAPEQLHGEATPATDLFGLGATIVALASGVEPEKVPRRGLRMDLLKHLPGLSPELVALLERMTEPEPDRRSASAREALAMLQERRAAAPGAAPSSTGRAAAPPGAAREPMLQPAGSPDDPLEDPTVPRPIRLAMRVTLFVAATLGILTVVIADAVLLPVVFALVRAFTKEENKPRIARFEGTLHAGLKEGRDALRDLQRRLHAGDRGRRPLPARKPEARRRLPPRH